MQLQNGHELAVGVYQQVLVRDPLNYAAHVNLGVAYAQTGNLSGAAQHLFEALVLYGRFVSDVAVFARTIIGRLAGRVKVMDDAGALPPELPHGAIEKIADAITTFGKVLNEIGLFEEALFCYRQAVTMEPGFALGHWNLSLALLTAGDFARGWKEYEWRWHWPDFPEPRRLLPVPTWRGEELSGKRIVVWTEQGYG